MATDKYFIDLRDKIYLSTFNSGTISFSYNLFLYCLVRMYIILCIKITVVMVGINSYFFS